MIKPTKETLEQLKKLKITTSAKSRKKSIPRKIFYKEGYSSLQYLGIVRRFIQKRYKLHLHEFELLLFIYPIKYFRNKDFVQFPYIIGSYKLLEFKHRGYITEVLDDKGKSRKRNRVYTFTKLTDKIIEEFYALMARERKLPSTPQHNPFLRKRKNPTNFEKRYLTKVQKFHELFNNALSRQEKEED